MPEPTLSFEFALAGHPEPQGSARMVPIGRRCQACGRAPQAITSDNRELAHWRRDIGLMASRAMKGTPPWKGAVAAEIIYVLARPEKMPRGRVWPSVRPDIDKLERGVLDACRGGKESPIVYHDDSQVVEVTHRKRYPDGDEPTGVIIRMRALQPELEGQQEELFG